MRTVYIGRIPEMTANLVKLYRKRTTPADISLGATWYDDAHRIMTEWSDSYGYSIATCAAVTAAISPQCDWSRNLIIADDILADRAVSVGGAINSNVEKARCIRVTRGTDTRNFFKSGPKVYAFSRNLAGDYNAVTVDTHATQAALNNVEVTVGLNAPKYYAFATAYLNAARKVAIEPAIFQAIVWHTWKRLYPRVVKIRRRTQWLALGEY